MLIYLKIAALFTVLFLILLLSFFVKGKHVWILVMVNFFGAALLSFYVFYYIGSYSGGEGDAVLWTDIKKVSEGRYNLFMDIRWDKKPEIFGMDGDDDALVIRFDPSKVKIASADKSYDTGTLGRCFLLLPKGFKYSIIEKGETEIRFNIKDGENYTVSLQLKDTSPGAVIKAFFIHDYRMPLETSTYWEKEDTIMIDK